MDEAAHTVLLISPSKSSSNFNTSNSDPTFKMSAKLVLRMEWNETARTCRDPFDTKKFSNISPENLVQWTAPKISYKISFKISSKIAFKADEFCTVDK